MNRQLGSRKSAERWLRARLAGAGDRHSVRSAVPFLRARTVDAARGAVPDWRAEACPVRTSLSALYSIAG